MGFTNNKTGIGARGESSVHAVVDSRMCQGNAHIVLLLFSSDSDECTPKTKADGVL